MSASLPCQVSYLDLNFQFLVIVIMTSKAQMKKNSPTINYYADINWYIRCYIQVSSYNLYSTS